MLLLIFVVIATLKMSNIKKFRLPNSVSVWFLGQCLIVKLKMYNGEKLITAVLYL